MVMSRGLGKMSRDLPSIGVEGEGCSRRRSTAEATLQYP